MNTGGWAKRKHQSMLQLQHSSRFKCLHMCDIKTLVILFYFQLNWIVSKTNKIEKKNNNNNTAVLSFLPSDNLIYIFR